MYNHPKFDCHLEVHKYMENKAICYNKYLLAAVAYPGILFGGGGQQIQLSTEDRKNGDLGAVAP